jgi:ABC-type branched-subunit amino acid transport system ATPase component/ABC-type branched-subunit amino acid transport system permease subunit
VTLAVLTLRLDIVIIGAIAGLGYAVLASGLVLVYRATRILNLAHGQIGAFAGLVLAELVHQAGIPYPLALPLAVGLGALVGIVLERTLVAPLSDRSRLAVLVATIGVGQILIVLANLLPDIVGQRFPVPVETQLEVSTLLLHGEHLAMLVAGPAVLAALALVLARTRYGLAIRAVADNEEAAKLSGIDTRRVSTVVWALAGALAALASILILPLPGSNFSTATATAMGAPLLLRALAAGLAGGLTDLPRAVGAGIAIGVGEATLYSSFPASLGVVDLVLFVGVLALLLLRRDVGATGEEAGFGDDPPVVPARLREHPRVRRIRFAALTGGAAAAVALPLVLTSSSDLFLLARIPVYAIIGISVVVLTGWSGQLSLAQMSFAGVGALGTAALSARGVPYGAALVYATAAGTMLALAAGAPALRLRGLLLSVTTLAFAVASTSYLFQLDVFRSGELTVSVVSPGRLGPFEFDSYRTAYYGCLVALLAVAAIAARLRRTGVGRRIVAVDANESSAAAMTVSPTAAKLTAFGVSGAIATFGGGLLAGVTRTFDSSLFTPEASLQVLAMVVVGGVGSVMGAVLGAIFVIGLPAVLGDSRTVQLATSGIGLLLILRFAPGGLASIFEAARGRLVAAVAGEGPSADDPGPTDAKPTLLAVHEPPVADRADEGGPGARSATKPILTCTDINVAIGGRTLVAGVDLVVHREEVVGLIGANGAGKTTLMNAIGGFVPATGSIVLGGRELSALAPVERARSGLGRSFQGARLFPRLTVRECVQVALEAREPAELVPSALALPPSVRMEHRSARVADGLLTSFGLLAHAEKRAVDLSTGMRRLVELVCIAAVQPAVVLLDEPLAGLAQREAEQFSGVLARVQQETGASVVVIEHDLPLVMEVSDRVYCLESGSVIAEGAPASVRDDPRVIASYLGTDERAVARSGVGPLQTDGMGGAR